MKLTKDEALSLVLYYSNQHKVTSRTMLNKLLARLNLHMIPIDFEFSLNKYGSFSTELKTLQENELYKTYSYQMYGKECTGYEIKNPGLELAKKIEANKLTEIMTHEEIAQFKSLIHDLSKLTAAEISDNEHKKLLVDTEDREKLKTRVNFVHIDIADLYKERGKLDLEDYNDMTLAALIEYAYYLSKFLMEKRFSHLEDSDYNYDTYMFDYYFLAILEEAVPFMKEQLESKDKNERKINKYYNYLVNSVKGTMYSFSLENKDLKDIAV